MPVIVAVAIRYIIMAAVQLGLWSLLEKGIGLFNQGVVAIMTYFGVDEETAKDIMANKILIAFEEVGIFAASLRTKLPIKVAEYFGFTSKGFAKRIITKEAAVLAEKSIINSTSKAAATAAEVEQVAQVIAKKSGWAINGVSDLLKYVTLIVGTPVGFFYMTAQFIDYAAWQNPYQKTFEGLMGFLGIKPDTKLPSAGTISAETWKRIYSTVDQLKPLGISFPFSGRDTPYSRENLANLVDEIAANMVKIGKDPTYKNVIAAVLLQLQFGGKEPRVPTFPSSTSTSGASTGASSSTSSSFSATVLAEQKAYNKLGAGLVEDGILGPKTLAARAKYGGSVSTPAPTAPTQIVTGIISGGTLGGTFDFVSRPDDLIENATELEDAMRNNLAPFLTSLPSRVIYEVRIVSSVKTADGFTQKGSVQRVISGYTTKGVPKYKNVVNKFAVLDLKIKTATGSYTKLTTIVLGPVDSVKFTAASVNLAGVAQTVQNNIIAPVSQVSTTPNVSNVPVFKQPGDETIQDIVAMGYTIDQAFQLIGGPNHNNGANYVKFYGSVAEAAKKRGWTPDLTRTPEPMTVQYVMSLGYAAEEAGYIVNGGSAYLDPTNAIYTGELPRERTPEPTPAPTTTPAPVTSTMSNEDRYEVIYNPSTNQWSVDDHQSGGTTNYPSRAAAFSAAGQSDPAPAKYATLYDYYKAQGKNLPSVQERSQIYQQLGLGQAAYYTGTAEQNTKLLNALQNK